MEGVWGGGWDGLTAATTRWIIQGAEGDAADAQRLLQPDGQYGVICGNKMDNIERERERERQTDRDRDRQRQRDRDTDRQTESQRDRQTDRDGEDLHFFAI